MRVSPPSDKYFTSIIQIYLFSWSIAVLSPQVREGGCKYVRGRLQVRARMVASTCEDGCKYVRGRLQVRARTDASTCEEGCNALRPRRVKLALKSIILFYIKAAFAVLKSEMILSIPDSQSVHSIMEREFVPLSSHTTNR